MEPLTVIGAMVSLITVAAGATWALRSKLSDIELAIRGHVDADEKTHAGQEARIIELEKYRDRR